MDATNMIIAARRGRWAVAAIFLANGFIVGSWAPQIPVLLVRLEITETVLGLLLLVFGLGAVVAMPWCGYLMARHGTRVVLRAFAAASAFGLLAVALAPGLWAAVPALFFLGGVAGGTDVAMNTNAVMVEQRLGRAIMSSSHGFWSLGGFAGAALGGFFIRSHGFMAHALLVTALSLAIIGAALAFLVADTRRATQERASAGWPKNPLIYLIGLVALFSMIPEGATLDWAALHLQQALGADIATAGMAFAAFCATMALMRFLGDRLRNRFGAVVTMRASSLIAAAGMLAAGLATAPWLAVSAFAFAGIGIANMVPIAFSAAGNQEGTASATGMSVVTTMGYSGILVAPSAIGFIGEHTGFGPVFIALSGLLIVVCLMAGLTRTADFRASSQAE